MAQITQEQFARMKAITGVTAVDATADAIAMSNEDITLMCISGNLWLNPLAVAVADATALKLTAGQTIDLNVASSLSLISDVTGATYQIVKWKRLWE